MLSGIVLTGEVQGEQWSAGIAFEDTYDLKYLTHVVTPQQTTKTILQSTGNIGLYTSLDMKVVTNPPNPDEYYGRISYYDATHGNLMYAYEDDTGWHLEDDPIDDSGDVGLHTSLAVGSDGFGRISYYDADQGDLKYAYEDSSGWHVWPTPVDQSGNVGEYTSITLDSSNNPHVSYYDRSNENLKYAYLVGGIWYFKDDIDASTNNKGLHTSIAADGNDEIYISYYDKTSLDLKYAWTESGVWDSVPLVITGNVGQYSSISVDSGNQPHISYYKKLMGLGGELWYKFKTASGGWQSEEPVDSGGNVGLFTSIAVDSSGDARISYYDHTNGNLKIGRRTGGSWIPEDLDTNGDVGWWTSLELDENDKEFVSYGAVSELPPRDPIVESDCDESSDCEYVHMIWVQHEAILGKQYNRLYYQRSSDGGESWDFPEKPISRLVESTQPDRPYQISRPSMSVVGHTIHVAWLRETHHDAGFSYVSVYYQKSTDNGDNWLKDLNNEITDVQINDLGPNDLPSSTRFAYEESLISIAATETYVHVAWRNGYKTEFSSIFYDKSLATVSENSDNWGGEVGEYSSISVDSQNRPYISFYDSTYTGLKISGSQLPPVGFFETQTVDGADDVGKHTSIALTEEDDPNIHMSYYDQTNGNLKYAYWNGNFWEYDTPDDASAIDGLFTSIALEPNDATAPTAWYPHISYYDQTNGNLKYAFYDGDVWTIEEVDDPERIDNDLGLYSSIALDSSNHPHISYYDASDEELKYAYDDGSGWSIESSMDTNPNVGEYTSIALDSAGLPHISYYDGTQKDLKYVHKTTPTTWAPLEVVDGNSPTEDVGKHTSLALDSSDLPYISYYDETHQTLRYSRKYWEPTPPPGQWKWEKNAPDTSGDHVGLFTSMALDAQDSPHISYYDVDNKRLKYSGPASGSYNFQKVQNDDILSAPWWDMENFRRKYGGNLDLALRDGELHLTFEGLIEPLGDLEYAYFDPNVGFSGGWTFQSPDEEGIVGLFSDMALNPSTWLPHISHWAQSHGDLRYSWQDLPGIWQTERVDRAGDVGTYSSIALENSPPHLPHIAYYDYTTFEVKYAYRRSTTLGDWQICNANPLHSKGYISLALDSSDNAHIAISTFGYKLVHIEFTPTPSNPCQFTYDHPIGLTGSLISYDVSIAVDAGNNPHISYYSYGGPDPSYVRNLRYVYKSVGIWNDVLVDDGWQVGWYNSIALDSGSKPHISYYDVSGRNLKYAYYDGSDWHLEGAIDAYGDVGVFSSIALGFVGSVDLPHISYFDATNGYLKYAHKDLSNDWHIDIVDESHQGTGLYTSIALEPDSPSTPTEWFPHISYYDEGGGQGGIYRSGRSISGQEILYRRGSSTGQGAWSPEAIVTERFESEPANPRVEVMGDSLLVTWQDNRGPAFMGTEIYSKKSSNWNIRTAPIETQGDVGQHSSMATTSQGYGRVSYYEASKGDLRYAYENADGWHKRQTPIAETGVVGQFSSIAVDPSSSNEYSRISYYDAANQHLYHAYENANGWLTDPVEITVGVDAGMFSSIEVGLDGKSRMTYFQSSVTGEYLMYASGFPGGPWTKVPIDGGMPILGAGFHSSLTLDPTGYYGRASYCSLIGDVKFAKEVSPGVWNPEVVHPNLSIQCGGTSVVVATDGLARIAYYDSGNKDLWYAYEDGGGWNLMTAPIDSAGDVGQFPSIAIDSAGHSRISYYDATSGNLKYAYEDNDGWQVMQVPIDRYGDVGRFSSLAMDSTNVHARISYYDATNGNLKYAHEDAAGLGNSWAGVDTRISDGDTDFPYSTDTIPRIGSTGVSAHVVWQRGEWKYYWEKPGDPLEFEDDVGQFASVTQDIDAALHVSYFDDTDGELVWKGQNALRQWVRKLTIDGLGTDIIGKYSSMNLDTIQRPHFSYWDETHNSLKYAYLDIDYFKYVEEIDNTGTVGKYTSIAVDSENIVHISYYDYAGANTNLKYASGQYGNWNIKIDIDPTGTSTDIGQYSSIAVDSKDLPHISYYDQTNGNLKYAYFDGATWQVIDDIDPTRGTNNVGLFTSLALDAQNHPHISYIDGTVANDYKVKCARWDGSTWIVEFVDSGASFGVTSIDIDSEEYSHISYYDSTSKKLKYSFEDANGWHSFTIDSNGDKGEFSSIVLDYFGYWHIMYYDRDSGDLWHAKESGFTLTSKSVYYDENRFNGNPSQWGEDHLIIPTMVAGEIPQYAVPDIAVIGNDRHVVYQYSYEPYLGITPSKVYGIGYKHRIDSIVEMNPMTHLKGTSAVRAPVQWLGRDQIFIIGGINYEIPPSSYYSRYVYRYDPYTDTHTGHCLLPYESGIAYTSAVYDPNSGEIFVFGGKDNYQIHDEIVRIDPSFPGDCTFTFGGERLPNGPRYGTSAVYMSTSPNEGILIFGGYDGGDNARNDIIFWRPILANPINSGASLPSGRAFTSAIVMTTDKEYAFVFGGESTSGYEQDPVVRVYNNFGPWVATPLEHTAFPTGEGRSRTSAISDGSYGFIFGGRDLSHGLLDDIVRFNPRVDSQVSMIELCTGLPVARDETSAAYYGSLSTNGGGSYVFGGGIGSPIPTDEVFQYVASYDKP
jgi:hypothetical protein